MQSGEHKPVYLNTIAERDGEAAYDWYLDSASPEVANRFAEALADTFKSIAQNPGLGSQRLFSGSAAKNWRFRSTPGFPYLVVYVENEDHAVILRILHTSRDIPKHLQLSGSTGGEREATAGNVTAGGVAAGEA